jgi:plasmid stabilization system protein ParE
MRLFVHDAADEDFLRAEVYVVFDDPVASERRRDRFLERCARRAERLARGATRAHPPVDPVATPGFAMRP